MDDSSDFSLSLDGSNQSRLLSESPMLPSSSSSSSSSDADLSISELSISDRPSPRESRRPFSLLAPHTPSTPVQTRRSLPTFDDNHNDDENQDQDQEDEPDDGEITQRQMFVGGEEDMGEEHGHDHDNENKRIKAKMREDKLQNDLFVLRKLNTVFSSFNEALDEVGLANERISQQLGQTESLLNKYVDILSKSEEYSRLIFDEEWEGSVEDDKILQREYEETLANARKEAEERALAEQREKERVEREMRERVEREERERVERDRKEVGVSRGGVRGVRGTRASSRGVGTRGGSTRGSAASRGGTTGTSTRGSGLARGTVRRS